MVKVTFADVVKKIGKTAADSHYKVIFQLHSAIYSVDEKNTEAVEALSRSFNEGIELSIVCEALTSLILEAHPAE